MSRKKKSAFAESIGEFLSRIHAQAGELTRNWERDPSHTVFYKILGYQKPLTLPLANEIAARLTILMNRSLARKRKGLVASDLSDAPRRYPFLVTMSREENEMELQRCQKGHGLWGRIESRGLKVQTDLWVSGEKLLDFYNTTRPAATLSHPGASGAAPSSGSDSKPTNIELQLIVKEKEKCLVIKIDASNDEAFRLMLEVITSAIRSMKGEDIDLSTITLRDKTPGSVVATIALNPELAERILSAYMAGALDDRIADVYEIELDDIFGLLPQILAPSPITASDPNFEVALAKAWHSLDRREVLLGPWRRLWGIMRPDVRLSPFGHLIGEDEQHAYASEGLISRRLRSFMRDMSVTWLAWPVTCALLIAATLWPIHTAFTAVSPTMGILTGLALSLMGAQVCASVLSPLAVGAGQIVLGFAFGVVNAIAIAMFGNSPLLARTTIAHDLFTAVTGGIVGLSAPAWPHAFPWPVIIAFLTLLALAIAAAGALMAQPRNARPLSEAAPALRWAWARTLRARFPAIWDTAGALCGSCAGACIGLIYGVTVLLSVLGLSPATAFAVPFCLIGGVTFACLVGLLLSRSFAVSATFGAVYAAIAALLCYAAIRLDGAAGLIAVSAVTALYHSNWFTAAFAVGAAFSTRAAVMATILEGAGGFVGFVIFRMVAG